MRHLANVFLLASILTFPTPTPAAESSATETSTVEASAAETSTVAASAAARPVSWNRLRFEAHKLFFTATTELTFGTEDVDSAAASWVAVPEGRPRRPSGSEVLRLDLETSFAGRRSVDRVWFDAHDAAAIQRSKRRLGKNGYTKDYRYTDTGTFCHRVAPVSAAEAKAEPDAWTKVEDHVFPWDGVGCSVVTEPTVLFYLLSSSDLREDEALHVCVFSNQKLVPVELRVDGREMLEDAGFVLRSPHGERTISEVETFRVAVHPLVEGDDDLELLGLEGDIVVLIDIERRMPVRLRGRVPHFGGVEVRLVEADLRDPRDL